MSQRDESLRGRETDGFRSTGACSYYIAEIVTQNLAVKERKTWLYKEHLSDRHSPWDESHFPFHCHSRFNSEALHGWWSRGILLQSSSVCGCRITGPLRDPGPGLCPWCQLNTISPLSGETINSRGNKRCLRSWGYCAPDQDRGIE